MYVGEDGYTKDPTAMKERVIKGIELAKKHDMYVIVDWHVHAPGDPTDPIYEGAMEFFDEISDLYPNDPYIIYELCNEPSSNTSGGRGISNSEEGWQIVKSYAEPIIKMLRDKGNENLIIVGNPNWSQRPDLAADDPIDDKNTVYAAHFYAGTHKPDPNDYVMSNIIYALEKGAPVFVSEWGTSEASGDGGPYLEEADKWLSFLNKYYISWVNWSLTNKNETSGAFTPYVYGETEAASLDPGPDQAWSLEELSVSGEYIRARIKGIEYHPIDRSKYYKTLWNFDDGTTQGFVVNPDSPITNITLSNEKNRLKIEGLGLKESNNTNEDGFWNNLRISADEWGNAIDIGGAEEIRLDVVVNSPTIISLAVVPQGPGNGWWTNPTKSVIVMPDDFIEQADDTYKINLTKLDEANITEDGLYHYEVIIDLRSIPNIDEETHLRNMILIFVDVESDFAGRMYIDNIDFIKRKH